MADVTGGVQRVVAVDATGTGVAAAQSAHLHGGHGPFGLPVAPLVGMLVGVAGLGAIGRRDMGRLALRIRAAASGDR
jgi:hypothetical protein